ncbi:MAG: alpha-hydroxy-acid oxidizing protein, partial [Rhodoferax sp.]|nr:alpha-hydroxy-acid oxidizing protein [Rhodoferax sp.]
MPIAPRLQDSDEARRAAQQRLPRLVFDYIDGGAGNEIAMAGNRAALARLKLQPRVLAAHTSCRLGTTLLGQVLD